MVTPNPLPNRPYNLRASIKESQLWDNIRRAAKTNPGLQELLDHAIMFYNLSNTK